jgi:hypothetical protein
MSNRRRLRRPTAGVTAWASRCPDCTGDAVGRPKGLSAIERGSRGRDTNSSLT